MLLRPGNRMEEETSNIPLSNELNLPPGVTNITVDNTANVSDFDEPDKCACGADKPKSDNRATKFSNCGNAICMFKECKVTCKRTDKVAIHQETHTDAEHRATHCTCGAVRRKVAGKDHVVCNSCNRVWCTIGDCFLNFSTRSNCYFHRKTCPF